MERIKTFDELTIRDNFLFQHVMRNERLCKHLIEKFLNIQIRSLQYQSFEKTIDLRLEGKSIRLDVFVKTMKAVFTTSKCSVPIPPGMTWPNAAVSTRA